MAWVYTFTLECGHTGGGTVPRAEAPATPPEHEHNAYVPCGACGGADRRVVDVVGRGR